MASDILFHSPVIDWSYPLMLKACSDTQYIANIQLGIITYSSEESRQVNTAVCL